MSSVFCLCPELQAVVISTEKETLAGGVPGSHKGVLSWWMHPLITIPLDWEAQRLVRSTLSTLLCEMCTFPVGKSR